MKIAYSTEKLFVAVAVMILAVIWTAVCIWGAFLPIGVPILLWLVFGLLLAVLMFGYGVIVYKDSVKEKQKEEAPSAK